ERHEVERAAPRRRHRLHFDYVQDGFAFRRIEAESVDPEVRPRAGMKTELRVERLGLVRLVGDDREVIHAMNDAHFLLPLSANGGRWTPKRQRVEPRGFRVCSAMKSRHYRPNGRQSMEFDVMTRATTWDNVADLAR